MAEFGLERGRNGLQVYAMCEIPNNSGLCGQAPSDYPDMAQYLVQIGIDSMSLNADTLVATTKAVLEAERRLADRSAPEPRVHRVDLVCSHELERELSHPGA